MGLRQKTTLWLLCSTCASLIAFPAIAPAAEPGRPVYVVPDLATYLYAISLWDKDVQFPVFIENGRFLDIFLKGYPGAELKELERKRVGKINEALIYRALYAAWGPETLDDAPKNVDRDDLKERLKDLDIEPQGIVITDPDDPEFAGGFALAAGHHQPLSFYTASLRRSRAEKPWKNSTTEAAKEKLREAVLELVRQWGYPYEGLGEGIDYITLAFEMPHAWKPRNPPRGAQHQHGFSMTDSVGRLTPSGLAEGPAPGGADPGLTSLYAYCGQLIEAAPHMALYQAMGSLFVETGRALYFDRWLNFHGLESVKGYQVLRTKLHTIIRDQRAKPKASLEEWHHLTDGGHGFGFIHVTAAGNAYKWYDGTVDDIPHGGPCAVFFAQSGSAHNPALTDTIAGRWLLNGAYVYYGSCSEPLAWAFNPAQTVAQTLAAGGTFAEAFQRKDTLPPAFRRPWKLIYIGDPLARPRFVEDPDEPEWSRTWRRGVALVREAECTEAVNLLEAAFAETPADRHDELWRDLLRTYELAVGIGTFDAPDPKRFFVPPFIDGWMLPDDVARYRPETGWRARLHVRLLKDAELSNLLRARAGLDQTPGPLKQRLRQEIKRLDASAVAAKMWLVLGPLERLGSKTELSRTFPAEAVNRGESVTGVDGPVRWTFKLVAPETYTVALPHPRSEKHAMYNALTFVYLDGDEPREAALQVTGSVASASDDPVVWVNGEFVPPGPITLKPGTNEIVVRMAAWKGGDPITFGMTLTEPDGTRSTAFAYVDLIKHLGVRTTPPEQSK